MEKNGELKKGEKMKWDSDMDRDEFVKYAVEVDKERDKLLVPIFLLGFLSGLVPASLLTKPIFVQLNVPGATILPTVLAVGIYAMCILYAIHLKRKVEKIRKRHEAKYPDAKILKDLTEKQMEENGEL